MSVVTVIIKSEGKELPGIYQPLSIEVNRELNRIPFAELVLLDGNPAKQEFALSDEAFFEPGKEVEIFLRYEGEGKSQSIFKGWVIRHNLEADALDSTLTVEVWNPAIAMTRGRKSEIFLKKSDANLIKDLISASGLKAGKIPATEPEHPEIVQFYCSNWDFMLTRAEANNLVVVVEDEEISLHKLEIKGKAKHSFEYGITELYGFEMEADASQQYENVESVSYDWKKQTLSQTSKAADFALEQSDLNGKSLAKKLGTSDYGASYQLSSVVPLDPKENKTWADGFMARSRMSLLRGVLSIPGIADMNLLDVMEIVKVGKRFNGKTLVTGIRHSVNQEGWQTHVQFGVSADSFSHAPHIHDAPAAGLMPAVQGLQIGIVDTFEEDKEGKEFRVRVLLPAIDPKTGKVWARLASPEAGKGRGYFFRPEKGDEVVVGFFNDDPRQAVILGSLFGSKNVPPEGWEKLDAENALKGIVSKTGITFEINDTEQTLTLKTSEDQSILLDEKNKLIEISDLNENSITLMEEGIQIAVSDKLSIEAGGDIELKGKNIKLTASADVEITGSKVDVK